MNAKPQNYLARAAIGLLALCVAAITSASPADPYHADSVTVKRYTEAPPDSHGVARYTAETGKLYLDGSFIPSSSAVYFCSTSIDDSDLSASEVASVAGACVLALNDWITLNAGVDYLGLFNRSDRTYFLAGVPHVIVTPKNGAGSGTSTVGGSGPRFINMSVRAVVPPKGAVIPGFVVADTPSHDKLQVLIRAIGPTLASFGVGGTLADPRLTVFDSSNRVVGTNDDWESTDKPGLVAATTKVGAFPLTAGSKDAALLVTLPPGSYTASIGASDSAAGEIMLEVYGLN